MALFLLHKNNTKKQAIEQTNKMINYITSLFNDTYRRENGRNKGILTKWVLLIYYKG